MTDTSYEIIKSETTPFYFAFISSPKLASGEAYNLNELLNSYAPSNFENANGISGSVNDIGQPNLHKTLTIGPGISVPTDTMPADIKKYATSYPTSYKMRAIGSYRITNQFCSGLSINSASTENSQARNLPGVNIGNTGAADRNNKNYYGGKIVQMRRVPASMMKDLKGFTLGDNIQSPYIYLFDSENAHDGMCNEGCTGGNATQ
jgi:hypothetical protein